MNRIVAGTTNSHKIHEIRTALTPLKSWVVETPPPHVPCLHETGTTFLENAIQKALHFSLHTDALTLADDSGLSVDALDGRPGIRSARYAPGAQSRIDRLLREMEAVPEGERAARFACALALARSGKLIWTGEGIVAGIIARTPSGDHGFGYDPVFYLPELGRTMAELTTPEKDKISHRGRALSELRRFLESW